MLFANNCNTTLASSLTSGATSMSVTSATGFPSPTGVQYFYCTLADAATQTTIEIVKVTSVSGTTFAITRAQDGTSATAFAAGAVVSLRLVRASLNDFPKLDETNTFNADQAISGQLTSSAGLATTGTFTATAPSDGLVMDYATGFGRFSAFAGDGFQWYNAGIANTKLMQLSSTGVITTATWNGATVTVPYGGTGLTTLTSGYIPYGNGTSAFSNSSNFQTNATTLSIGTTLSSQNTITGGVEFGSSGMAVSFSDPSVGIGNNFYYNSGWKYKVAGTAQQLQMPSGAANYAFLYASSGSAGGAISWSTALAIGATGGVSIGNTTDPGATNLSVTGSIIPNAVPSSQWGIDFAPSTGAGSYITLAAGATYDIASGSGMVLLHSNSTGQAGFFICYAGVTALFAGNATIYVSSSSPLTSQIGFFYNVGTGKYRITNGYATSQSIFVSTIRTRTNS